MSVSVTAWLKSKQYINIDDLEYIIDKSPLLNESKKITEFKDFHIVRGHELTLVGKTSTVALSSNEIEYIKFDT